MYALPELTTRDPPASLLRIKVAVVPESRQAFLAKKVGRLSQRHHRVYKCRSNLLARDIVLVKKYQAISQNGEDQDGLV